MWKADARGNMAPSVQYRRKNSAITAAVFCGGPSHSADALAQVSRTHYEDENSCQCLTHAMRKRKRDELVPCIERDLIPKVPTNNVTMA